MFKIVSATIKAHPDMALLWLNAFVVALNQHSVKRAITAGIKYINASAADDDKSMKSVQARFTFIDCVICQIGQLTPHDFMQLFPADKRYDGGEDFKDYFSSMEFVRTLEQNKPIGGAEETFNFLWEYMNAELHVFLAEHMSNMNSMAHLKGQPGPTDKLIEDMGLDVFYLGEDPVTGKEILYNSSTGDTAPLKKPIPRYLKVVK